jgi:hypothetical protein
MFKFRLLFTFLCFLLLASLAKAQDIPSINFNDLIVAAEENPVLVQEARRLAQVSDLPHSIYLPEGVFIEAKSIENNRVVYSVINDLQDIYNNGDVVFWEEVAARFNLSEARVHWTGKATQNPLLGYKFASDPAITPQEVAPTLVLVPESTNDAVMAFDYNDGSLIDIAFVPGGNPNLGTPIEALLTPNSTILVSDQIADNIVEFDTAGSFVRVFYGGNTAIYDNARGIELRPGVNTVLGTVAGGANSDAIVEFDLATGNYLGNFITPNAAQMDGPWDIIFRTSDCLVSASSTNNISRYDLNGNYLGAFVPSISFPEQLYQTSSGNIIAAGFSGTSGLYIYDANGAQVGFFGTVTGLRGAIQLGNGNYMVTSGGGVYILDQNTGAILSQPVSALSARFATAYDLSIIPVELTSFSAATANGTVVLNWATATETNNSGFEVQRSTDKISYSNIGFVNGHGTTAEPKSYSFTDNTVNSGAYYYRLKQIDYNGAFEYSNVIEVEVGAPDNFSLEQNYPNPFNPSTVISYQMPVNENVVLKIYDVLGNEVTTLVNEFKEAGKYSIEFDASNLGSGIYFYTITAGNFTSTKKMTLIK